MSEDTEKKTSKSKPKDRVLGSTSIVQVMDNQPVEDSDGHVETTKKKKKKKIRQKDGDAQVGNVDPDGQDSDRKKKKSMAKEPVVAGQEVTIAGDAMIVDSDETSVHESEKKKKKKKKRHAEEGEPMPVDAEEKKKKEKRKRKLEEINDADMITADVAPSASEPKKERKEKKKRRKDDSSTHVPLNPSDSSSTPSKATSPQTKPHNTSFFVTASATLEEATAFLTRHSITIHTPPGVDQVIPVIKFSQLDVPAEIQSTFSGFKEPTPIQACTWPPALEGRDVVGIAETGSGKTLAFGVPALCRLINSKISSDSAQSTISVLVVAPTRELAIQTHETLSALGKPFGIASVAVFGGVPKDPQVKMLKNVNKPKDGMTTRIIVGTPGRILDLMQEGVCDLSGVDYLVLDEADRMLDKGFENDIRNIISSTKPSKERQTMMFSATWPEAVRRLASTFQRDPVRVTVGSDDLTANSRVEQSVEVFDDARSKDQRLLNLLKSLSHKKTTTTGASESRILVFALYKKEASRVEQMLHRQGYSVGALHGDMSQNARMDTLENFKNGTTGLMVATDVAARGLDIPNVGAVINYTFPLTIEDYIHRIGRTGRGGKSGKSITFFTGDAHERSLAGEFARVLREGGFDYEALKKFPMTIKKKEHSAYGAFFRDDIPTPKGPTKIVF